MDERELIKDLVKKRAQVIYVFRHGRTEGADRLLSKESILESNQKIGGFFSDELYLLPTDYFYSPLPRGIQTVLAGTANIIVPNIHPAQPLLGTQQKLAEIYIPEVEEMINLGASALAAIFSIHAPEKVSRWRKESANGIRSLFSLMGTRYLGCAIGHIPFLPLALLELGWKEPRNLDYLDYVRVVKHLNGRITVLS